MGTLHHSGYLVFLFLGKQVRYHRAIYLLHRTSINGVIDHVNRNKLDNRIENLRDVTHSQNAWNKDKANTNSSGVKGLRWLEAKGLWRGVVKKNYKMYYVHSADKNKAIEKLEKLRKELHGEFAVS